MDAAPHPTGPPPRGRVRTDGEPNGAGDRRARNGQDYHRDTHRAVPPEETWQRIRPQLPQYGVTRVADVTGLDDIGIPVFQAVRPASRTVSVSQGKGLTAAARVSAAMEATELWHAKNPPTPSTVRKAAELDLPCRLAQLDLAEGSLVHDGLALPWLEGEGLLTGTPIPVPGPAVRLDHTYRAEWTFSLLLVRDLARDRIAHLGDTLDNAAGECFDNVARVFGLPYPGCPAIDRAARGDPRAVPFPRPLTGSPGHRYDLFFSGLKTAAARWAEGHAGRELAGGRRGRLAPGGGGRRPDS